MTFMWFLIGAVAGTLFQRYVTQRRTRKLLEKIESVIFSKGTL